MQFDFYYVSDNLWGSKNQQNTQFASWNRFRATVDIDFGRLSGQDGWYFHATALTQGGGNLGQDLGLVIGPSSLVSFDTTRLDSWWIEKRWLDDRIAVRVGQFAGQDFYGNAQFGESFINGPMGYALGNLFTTFESFNPFATPAAEIRIVPIDNLYLKSMVMAGDPSPLTSNPTGLVPTFRGNAVFVSEIGFTPGRNATSAPVDDAVHELDVHGHLLGQLELGKLQRLEPFLQQDLSRRGRGSMGRQSHGMVLLQRW